MNNYTAIGRLGRDAEVKHTADGTPITTFTVAVDYGFGDRKVTSWVDCAMYGDRGPKIADFIRKGDRIGIVGPIRLDTYKTRDGEEKSKIAMLVQDVTLLGGKSDGGQRTQRQAQQEPAVDDFEGDSIPF